MKRLVFLSKLLNVLGIVGLVTIVTPVLAESASYFIRDNATGGDCTSIGNWAAATKTCLLTQNVNGEIEVVDDNLTLDGNGYMISALSPGSGTGVSLSSRSGVTLQKLNVQGFSDGIQLIGANSNTLTGNTVSNNSHAGILLRSSSLNTLSGNTASATTSGGSGIWLWNQSNSNILTENITVGNSAYGIFLDANSDGNSLTWNSTLSDAIGIRLIFGSDLNTVAYNTMSNHRLWGMDLYISANNNFIYNNNFIDTNTDRVTPLQQIRVVSSSGNVFNLAAPRGGNYWNDYDSSAEGCNDVSPADGFCDQPYVFAGGPDNLPLTSPVIKPVVYVCIGFEPPLNDPAAPVVVRKPNRALPFKAELVDENGNLVTNTTISAPPVIQVLYTPVVGGTSDISGDTVAVGLGTAGNQFVFTDEGKWQFNLKLGKSESFSAPGTYTVTMEPGDTYLVNPTCTANFVIE